MRLFPQAFECHSKPWRAWDPSFPAGCNNLNAAYYSTASISIFTDLVILVLPLPQLMKLNIHQRRKCMPTSIETERVKQILTGSNHRCLNCHLYDRNLRVSRLDCPPARVV